MQKIKDIINKILGKDSSSDSSGFTLIELLIVIAVIGILAAALLVAIDPIDKVRAGNDTKVLNDTRAIYDAAGRYYTQRFVFPGSSVTPATADWEADIEGSEELKIIPNPPGGYIDYVLVQVGDEYVVYGQVQSKGSINKADPSGSGTAPYYYAATAGGGCYSPDVPDETTLPAADSIICN